MNYCYVRLTTRNSNPRPYLDEVAAYAKEQGLSDVFPTVAQEVLNTKVEQTEYFGLLSECHKGDLLIIPSMSMLSGSLIDVNKLVKLAMQKQVKLQFLQPFVYLDTNSNQALRMLEACADFERQVIINRVKEALEHRKREGAPVGRPVGSGKSFLDDYKVEILKSYNLGESNASLARKYNTTAQNMHKWLKKHARQTLSVIDMYLDLISEVGGQESLSSEVLHFETARQMVSKLLVFAGSSFAFEDVQMFKENDDSGYLFLSDMEEKKAYLLSFSQGAKLISQEIKKLGLNVILAN